MKKLIVSVIMVLLSGVLLYQPTLLEVIKLRTFDAFVQTEQPTGNVVVLNLTEDDIHREGGWPFPRQRLAQIHTDLLDRGAVSVSWVAAFSEPDRFGGDAAFAKAATPLRVDRSRVAGDHGAWHVQENHPQDGER
jgi:CHASE2 domain-containing sensor protein